MTHSEYAAIDAINFSTLKAMALSPAHYRHALARPRTDADVLRVGRAVHCAVFEPERFARSFPTFDGQRRGKEWAAFLTVCGGDYLRGDEPEWVRAVSAAVRSDRHAAPLIEGGKPEQALTWTDAETGLPCKCRVDYLRADVLPDLKTTRDASVRGFGRAAARYHYYAQLAMYLDGVQAATGWLPVPHLIAVESAEPHVVQVYRVSDDDLEAGRVLYRGWLARVAECRAADRWPGYADGIADLALPGWVWGDEENETGLDGLGLVFSGDDAAEAG